MIDKTAQSSAEMPEADVKHKSSRFSAIWIIPVVAAVIGGWMVFQSALEGKVIVEVEFKNASSIEAGKTLVKLRDIVLGKVTKVEYNKDLSGIKATLEFKGIKSDRFTDSMRFWVVKPRIGVGGISGLDTILSGAYIEVDPGEGGKPTSRYVALEEPGIYQLGNPGTSYILKTDKLGSLGRGTPVKFRDVDVGSVTSYKLAEDNSHVEVDVFIHAPYDKLVKADTRFWNISGLSVSVGAEGAQLDMASVASLVVGGIEFSSDDNSTDRQAKEKTAFMLYNKEQPDIEEEVLFKVPMKLYFANGVNGLTEGAPVEYKGLRLGTVTKVAVELPVKESHLELSTFAMIDIEPDRLPGITGIKFTDEQRLKNVYNFFEQMVKKGLRGQLRAGNLLTGKSLVQLDMFPGAKTETVKYINGVAILPTVPETMVVIEEKVNKILDRLAEVPVKDIGVSIADAASSINALAESYNDGGAVTQQMLQVMEELTQSAQSLRGLTNYLERHPEALLKGKSPE
ncbi:MAG: MlaD family protein [Gammaproteobacteria bacterium]|nr:MlaD family protein [Gammaproteobacteria bacterium]